MADVKREWHLPRHSIRWGLLSLPVWRTASKARALRSRLTYGPNPDGTYSTSVLGVLNGLLGIGVRLLPCPHCDEPNGDDEHAEIRERERAEARGVQRDDRGLTVPTAKGRIVLPSDGSAVLYEPLCEVCNHYHHPSQPHREAP